MQVPASSMQAPSLSRKKYAMKKKKKNAQHKIEGKEREKDIIYTKQVNILMKLARNFDEATPTSEYSLFEKIMKIFYA